MRTFAPLFAASAALCLAVSPAGAAHITFSAGYDGPWEWDEITMTTRTEGSGMSQSTYYKGTARITGHSGSATELTIPSKIAWYHDVTGPDVSIHYEYEVDVVEIGSCAFSGSSGLTSVTIPDSVTSIGDNAFNNCSGLTSMTIGNGVTSIGARAFYNCSGLTSLAINGNVTNDYSDVYNIPFKECSNLQSVSLGNKMTKIGALMFYNCSGLTSVTIPDSVTSIGDYAFNNCSGLTSVTIPDSVTSIGNGAFNNCSGLTSVTIPDSVTSIGDYAFYNCSGLQNVYLSDIAAWCAVDFKNSESSPFYYASNLFLNGRPVTDLIIPDGVESISAYAFNNCDCLRSVQIPDCVTNLGSRAFSACDNFEEIRVPQCAMTQGLSSVFSRSYQKLRRITLGPDVAEIRDDEFHNFRALEEIAVENGNANYRVSSDGCLYNAAITALVACPRNAAQVAIPSSVTRIYDYALDGCGTLWANWYKALSNLAADGDGTAGGPAGGGTPSGGGGAAAAPDPRYSLASGVADRAIATVTVDGDSAIDSFVLTDGKVFDTVLRVVNVSDSPSTLTLPSGYAYERLRGTDPLTIPALSTNLLTITRTADRVFFVAREELEPAQ